MTTEGTVGVGVGCDRELGGRGGEVGQNFKKGRGRGNRGEGVFIK